MARPTFTIAGTGGPFQTSQTEIDEAEVPLLMTGTNENPRVVGAALAVLLGPFGGHRLYLGTSAKVPILYVLTLGGGFGVLPLIDLGHILFTKDLDKYRNSEKVLMWAGK